MTAGSRTTTATQAWSWCGITATRRSTTIIRLKNSSRVRTSAPWALTAETYLCVDELRRALCW